MSATILIVDDDPVQRRLLEALVRRFGYAVETADGGDAALTRLMAKGVPSVDLLILDLVMPDLDGMGVLTRLRESECLVPTIVQTAHGSIEAVISAMRAGATDFVVKPVGAERKGARAPRTLGRRHGAAERFVAAASRHLPPRLIQGSILTPSDECLTCLHISGVNQRRRCRVLIASRDTHSLR